MDLCWMGRCWEQGKQKHGMELGMATAATMLSLDELLEVLLSLLLHDRFTGPNICRQDKKQADTFPVLEEYAFIIQKNKKKNLFFQILFTHLREEKSTSRGSSRGKGRSRLLSFFPAEQEA